MLPSLHLWIWSNHVPRKRYLSNRRLHCTRTQKASEQITFAQLKYQVTQSAVYLCHCCSTSLGSEPRGSRRASSSPWHRAKAFFSRDRSREITRRSVRAVCVQCGVCSATSIVGGRPHTVVSQLGCVLLFTILYQLQDINAEPKRSRRMNSNGVSGCIWKRLYSHVACTPDKTIREFSVSSWRKLRTHQ
jgi:hypothetical protein